MKNPDKAESYIKTQDKIVLNWAEAERVKENKTVNKRKYRENRHDECVTADVVEESNQPEDPNRVLTPYEAMRRAISENMKDLQASIRELTEDQFQMWEGTQKTSDEKVGLTKRAARKRSYVPCFGDIKATFIEQVVYLTKLRGIVELMKNNEESPKVLNDDDGKQYGIKLTATEAVEIPPYSQKQIALGPLHPDEVLNDELHLFHGSHASRYTLQDGTFINKEGTGTIANYSKRPLFLKRGHIIGYAKKAEFVNLPTLDDIFDMEDLVVNAVEIVRQRIRWKLRNRNLKPNSPKSKIRQQSLRAQRRGNL